MLDIFQHILIIDMLITCLKWHKDEFVQSVRLVTNEVASDDGRERLKHVRKIVNIWLITHEGDNTDDIATCFLWFSESSVISSPNNIHWLIFVMYMWCALCEAGTEILYSAYTNFRQERIQITWTLQFQNIWWVVQIHLVKLFFCKNSNSNLFRFQVNLSTEYKHFHWQTRVAREQCTCQLAAISI
jgi:hypothetical protein